MPTGVYIRKHENALKHGGCIGGYVSRLYVIWRGMRRRCSNKNYKGYHRYGGRGITVCDIWEDFAVFREWALTHGYNDSMTIDRINNNGNYEPNNCQWILKGENIIKDQAKPVRQLDLEGNLIATYPSVSEASRQTGIHNIGIVCNGGRCKKAGGYKWTYVCKEAK